MNTLKPIFSFGINLVFSLLAASALADSPVISSHWEEDGWVMTPKLEEADITVLVTYAVPGVIQDSDLLYFKQNWFEVREHADGTNDEGGHWYTGGGIKSRCCMGYSGISFDGMPEVQIEDKGAKVILDLSWRGRKTGHLIREFLVPWSELEKTVKDKDIEIHVSLSYPLHSQKTKKQTPDKVPEIKPKPTQKQIQESNKISVSLPVTTPFDSDPKAKALYLEQFEAGYRNIVAELGLDADLSRFDFKKGVKESVFNAYLKGWSDGLVKALKDHPEKQKVYPTVYEDKTDYQKSPNPDTGLYINSSKANVQIK